MLFSSRERLNWAGTKFQRQFTLLALPLALYSSLHAQVGDAAKPLVTSAGAVHSLKQGDAKRALPVRFRGVVTFYDPVEAEEGATLASLFVLDKTGGAWVGAPGRPILPIKEGSLVEITGETSPGDFAPTVFPGNVKILGTSKSLSHPQRVSVSELATGAYDCLFVEVEGIVHSVSKAGHLMSLQIATRDGPIRAMTVAKVGMDYSHLMDASIRLRGVAAVDYNKHQQMTGVHLFFQDPNDITITREARGDPFALHVRTIDSLARYDPHASANEAVHVRGRVSLQWPGQLLCVQDETGGLCVPRSETNRFPEASWVDVVGYPVLAAEIPALTDATARLFHPEDRALQPEAAKAPAALLGDVSGKLVALEGALAGVSTDGRQWLLTVLANGVVFTAVLPRSAGQGTKEEWREGSVVRVTGICINEVNKQIDVDWSSMQRLSSFRILMRSTNDVTVLRKPSWWTPGHTFVTLTVGALVTLAIFCWVVLLRRKVEQKTQELRESERRFRHLAHHDNLTGVPNRAWFHERAAEALTQCRRGGDSVGLLLLDLDHFKPVNDTFGHDAGDAMLCELTKRVGAAIREVDTLARLGGDEFAVVLPDMKDGEDAERVARKILEAVCQPVEIKGKRVGMSVSIGVAVFPDDGNSVTDLLRSADLAMYESKKVLRGGVRRYRREVTIAQVEELTPMGQCS